jgi:hypothetical protein
MKRKWLLALALPAVALLLVTEPWTALIVTEASEPPPAGAGPVSRGALVSLEHESSGTAQIFEGADGKRWLRLDPFETSNGPDVVVMLSPKNRTAGSATTPPGTSPSTR